MMALAVPASFLNGCMHLRKVLAKISGMLKLNKARGINTAKKRGGKILMLKLSAKKANNADGAANGDHVRTG